jgi:hypothetical protein
MDDRPWQLEFAQQLKRQGLPRGYTERLLEELTDHHHDLMEEEVMNASESVTRLGRSDNIASTAAQEYRRSSFVGRHPRIVFLLCPFAVLPVLWITALIGLVLSSDLLGLHIVPVSRVAILLPAMIATLLFYRLSRRAGLALRWPVLAWSVLGLLAGCAWVELTLNPSGQRSLLFAFGFARHTLLLQSLQLLGPLMLGGLLLWRDARSGRRMCAA